MPFQSNMKVFPIELHHSNHWKPEIHSYLNQEPPFNQYTPYGTGDKDMLKAAGDRKFSADQRTTLVESLLHQYNQAKVDLQNSPVHEQIQSLKDPNTRTICTGQQLHIGLGPMYVFHKIISVLATCSRLNSSQNEFRFVPVYWLASEDHDIEEIQQIRVSNRLFTWKPTQDGVVGRLPTDGLNELIQEVLDHTESDVQSDWWKLVQRAYSGHKTFANATIQLIHEVFGDYGLVVLDSDKPTLKKALQPILEADLEGRIAQGLTKQTNEIKTSGLKAQVGAQSAHFFYLEESGKRTKIEFNADRWTADSISWTKAEILSEFKINPERFSPNVVTRPCYQEAILPNVAYLGGPGEISYWLQLTKVFEACGIFYPVLGNRIAGIYPKIDWLNEFETYFYSDGKVVDGESVLLTYFPNESTHVSQIKDHIIRISAVSQKINSSDKRFEQKTKTKLKKVLKDLDIVRKHVVDECFKNRVNRLAVRELFFFLSNNGNLTERSLNYPPSDSEKISIAKLLKFHTDNQVVNNDLIMIFFT